jgi:hypothetical protein
MASHDACVACRRWSWGLDELLAWRREGVGALCAAHWRWEAGRECTLRVAIGPPAEESVWVHMLHAHLLVFVLIFRARYSACYSATLPACYIA